MSLGSLIVTHELAHAAYYAKHCDGLRVGIGWVGSKWITASSGWRVDADPFHAIASAAAGPSGEFFALHGRAPESFAAMIGADLPLSMFDLAFLRERLSYERFPEAVRAGIAVGVEAARSLAERADMRHSMLRVLRTLKDGACVTFNRTSFLMAMRDDEPKSARLGVRVERWAAFVARPPSPEVLASIVRQLERARRMQ